MKKSVSPVVAVVVIVVIVVVAVVLFLVLGRQQAGPIDQPAQDIGGKGVMKQMMQEKLGGQMGTEGGGGTTSEGGGL